MVNENYAAFYEKPTCSLIPKKLDYKIPRRGAVGEYDFSLGVCMLSIPLELGYA
jgi:hypothetical protein